MAVKSKAALKRAEHNHVKSVVNSTQIILTLWLTLEEADTSSVQDAL